MKLNTVAVLWIAGLLAASAGCARTELNAVHLNHHVQVNPSSEPVKKHFKESEWAHHFVFRLVPTERIKYAELLASHVGPGDKVVGLKVAKETSFVNGLICVLIGVVYCPETIIVEGDVVSATPAAP